MCTLFAACPQGAVKYVSDEAALDGQIDLYTTQVHRYRQAVASVLKSTVQTTLCFLDYSGTVRWEDVR